jgi:hypothetical protein
MSKKTLKRLLALSINDLRRLQTAVLDEIKRRKELAANPPDQSDEEVVSLPMPGVGHSSPPPPSRAA